MNIQSFVNRRKELGLSQKELSNGVCTQATLSKFENNGKIPSLKILIQLCNRLDLSLDDVMGVNDSKSKKIVKSMNKVEFNLITYEYADSWDIINKIDTKLIKDDNDALLQYYYLKGILNVLDDGDLFDSVFDFNQILTNYDSEGKTIFTFLAYTGMGMVYAKQNDSTKSEYYFSKVFNDIYGMEIENVNQIWRYISIIFYCALYYSDQHDFETANTLLNYGIKVGADNHVTYYIARLYAQLAINDCAVHGSSDEMLELLTKARVFSEFNNNQKELLKIKKLIKDCK
ncbi:helix-turn-helix domain-containing protein [Companilactobacillus hulinensis]|uniref:helix-turn-helix domain-containing protein n=1 Tax=Companilactobacillus hulinensis TaxID=2486007 RepID=UPI000F783792|nr:helix-turn-helix transcriptional regulator [Companilactobacillus hulinensis]